MDREREERRATAALKLALGKLIAERDAWQVAAAGWRTRPPGPDRWKERSRTLAGIAEAMASQWGCAAA